MKIRTRGQLLKEYKKKTGNLPPIVVGINNKELMENVQTIIMSSYLDGYSKAKRKYKDKYKQEINELKNENLEVKKNLDSIQNSQIALANRIGFVKAFEESNKQQLNGEEK